MALLLRLLFAVLIVSVSGQVTKITNTTSSATIAEDHSDHDHSGHDHSDHDHGHGSTMVKNMTKALAVPDSCVGKPLQGNCSSFDYPHVNAVNDLNRLCAAMSFMTACSVATACDKAGGLNGSSKVSSSNADICRPFNQVITVCRLDTGMGRMAGCDNYRTMCVEGSPVTKCKMPGLTAIPTTKAVNAQVRAICEASPNKTGCAQCTPNWAANKTWADCDLLAVYSGLCGKDPSMPQCVEYHRMCSADKSLSFCAAYTDNAKKVAGDVLKNKGADPDSKQGAASTPAGRSGASTSAAGSVVTGALVAAAAVLLL